MISKEKLEEVGKKYCGGYIFEKVEKVMDGIYYIRYDLDNPCPVSMDLMTMEEELDAFVYYNFCYDDWFIRIGVISNEIMDNLLDFEYNGVIFSDLTIALQEKYFTEFKNIFIETKVDALMEVTKLFKSYDVLSAWQLSCSIINKMDFSNGVIIKDCKFIRPTWNEAVAAIREEMKKNKPIPVVKRSEDNDQLYWEIPKAVLHKLELCEGDKIDWDISMGKGVSIYKRD